MVLRPLGLGDLLTGVPAIRAIRAAVPDHRLVLATTTALEPLASLIDVVDEVPVPRLYLGFRLPVDDTPDFFAASAAMDALAGLTIARMERRLVRELELCTDVSAASMGLADNVSLGFFVAEAAPGVELDRIEDELCTQLEEFAAQGPRTAARTAQRVCVGSPIHPTTSGASVLRS